MEDRNSRTVGVVAPCVTTLSLPNGGLRLERGGVLSEVKVQWEGCGLERAENDNVVFICHALTGDAHVAGIRPGEDTPSGWWEGMVGPGKAIDTNVYRVICANVLGGCSGTTGPSSINPTTGRPYGGQFPLITISDTVDVYRMLLLQLGVKRLRAIIGGSFGGIQVIDWITRYPDEMDNAAIIASAVALNTQALAFDVVGRNAIIDDPRWQNGDYYDVGDGKGPARGLAGARQLAHITYLSRSLLQRKFGRNLQPEWLDKGESYTTSRLASFHTLFQIESYLDHQADKFLNRFDANSYLYITHAMDEFDAAKRYGSLDNAFARIKCRTLVVSFSGDVLFPDEESRTIVSSLLRNHKRVSYCHLEIGVGHDAFLTHIADLSQLVGSFLGTPKREIRDWQRRRYAQVSKMIPDGAHVLDIGCGAGTLMNILREEKNVKADGIEISVKEFESAYKDGNEVLFQDVDQNLSLIPDKFYDTAVLFETLQVVRRPRELLQEALRVADEAVVSFPNFASYSIRFYLGLLGRLPVSRHLPFMWYNTPNIHCVTLKDFNTLLDDLDMEAVEVQAISNRPIGKLLCALGLKNLGAQFIVARIRRKK